MLVPVAVVLCSNVFVTFVVAVVLFCYYWCCVLSFVCSSVFLWSMCYVPCLSFLSCLICVCVVVYLCRFAPDVLYAV